MPVNNDERKTRYWLLKKAGFSSKDAGKFKDLSMSKIEQIIKARQVYNKAERVAYNTYVQLVKEIQQND